MPQHSFTIGQQTFEISEGRWLQDPVEKVWRFVGFKVSLKNRATGPAIHHMAATFRDRGMIIYSYATQLAVISFCHQHHLDIDEFKGQLALAMTHIEEKIAKSK